MLGCFRTSLHTLQNPPQGLGVSRCLATPAAERCRIGLEESLFWRGWRLPVSLQTNPEEVLASTWGQFTGFSRHVSASSGAFLCVFVIIGPPAKVEYLSASSTPPKVLPALLPTVGHHHTPFQPFASHISSRRSLPPHLAPPTRQHPTISIQFYLPSGNIF